MSDQLYWPLARVHVSDGHPQFANRNHATMKIRPITDCLKGISDWPTLYKTVGQFSEEKIFAMDQLGQEGWRSGIATNLIHRKKRIERLIESHFI